MGEYGLACANIVSATMVLASGEIVYVDEEENADLLWGIKGGERIVRSLICAGPVIRNPSHSLHLQAARTLEWLRNWVCGCMSLPQS